MFVYHSDGRLESGRFGRGGKWADLDGSGRLPE